MPLLRTSPKTLAQARHLDALASEMRDPLALERAYAGRDPRGLGRRSGSPRGGGRRGATYDPSSEDGYTLDFWAESGITEAGTGVAAWQDATGTLSVEQDTDGNRPAYQATGLGGKPAVLFQKANSDALVAAAYANASTDWTVYEFLDLKSTTSGDWQYIVDSRTGRLIFEHHALNLDGPAWYDGSHKDPSGTDAATGAKVTTWQLDASGTQGQVWNGSASLGTATYSPTSMGGRFTIGGADGESGQFSDAAVGRILVFAALHDAAARQRVWDWGASHYDGLTL